MFSAASPLDGASTLADVEKVASVCEKCELSRGRNSVVFGVGNADASLMFIGEAPGRDEDLQGIPFVGRAGQLLDKILAAASIARDDVYIGNIIKCRPPNNRTPLTNEIEACMPYLAKQIEFIRPRIICTLGLPATQTLLGVRGSMASLRGKIYRHGDILIIPTYHPAAALRDPRYKKPIWEDFQVLKREYLKAP
jgi:DNA polymerase